MNYNSRNSFTALSLSCPGKLRCGDSSYAGIVRIQEGECILLLVADGVSSTPKDWLASGSTIDCIVQELQSSDLAPNKALQRAISIANQKIFSGISNTLGMLTTLSAVIFQPIHETLYLKNIGDSRILGLKNGAWLQLTEDDSTSIPYPEKDKRLVYTGVPISYSVLTKAIGRSYTIDTNSKLLDSKDYEALLLASDGFYQSPGFEQYAMLLAKSWDLTKASRCLENTILSEILDDASFAFLRLPPVRPINLREIVKERDSTLSASHSEIMSALEHDLQQCISENENDHLDKLLNFMDSNQFFFDRKKMIELLEKMIANKNPCTYKMIALTRKT